MNETPVNIEKAIEIAKEYKDLVAEHLPLKALYLYGSYSKGNYTEDSDIDIAVVVERMSDDYFEDAPLLWKLKRKISNLSFASDFSLSGGNREFVKGQFHCSDLFVV